MKEMRDDALDNGLLGPSDPGYKEVQRERYQLYYRGLLKARIARGDTKDVASPYENVIGRYTTFLTKIKDDGGLTQPEIAAIEEEVARELSQPKSPDEVLEAAE